MAFWYLLASRLVAKRLTNFDPHRMGDGLSVVLGGFSLVLPQLHIHWSIMLVQIEAVSNENLQPGTENTVLIP